LLHEPDKAVSFESLVKQAAERHARDVTISYDFFFGGNKRELHPNHPDYKAAILKMNEVCKRYGVGFGASVLNPLDIGWDFRKLFGVGGEQHVYQEGKLNPDGTFDVIAPLNKVWVNNKGPVELKLLKVRAFSFKSEQIPGTDYYAVPPESIQEIHGLTFKEIPGDFYGRKSPDPQKRPFPARFVCGRLEVKGKTTPGAGDRVLVVLHMATPDMDYFDPRAWTYTKDLLDWYHAHGVDFLTFYSDEMHIWFDWDLGTHFGKTELRTRYLSPGMQKVLAEKLGEPFDDADKMLVYHCYGEREGNPHSQYVLGDSAEDVARTMRLRKLYFELLEDQVTSLCIRGKRYAESLYGQRTHSRNHATWQEAPTCDHMGKVRYDYTPAYQASSSIREAISACYDYFEWNDFLTGGGNDFCEGGFLDRDYYGGAMAASFASLNEYQTSYWGAWGFPAEVGVRQRAVAAAYGMGPLPFSLVNEGRPRKAEVALVYPLDLLYADERFGSWMVQYGYANYITDRKIASLGKVENGTLKAGLDSYRTVVVLYAPFISKQALAKLRDFVKTGGTLIWESAPATLAPETGESLTRRFEQLFGVRPEADVLHNFTTRRVTFTGPLSQVEPMEVLTDLLPDRVYPVQITAEDVVPVAYAADGALLGTYRRLGKGCAVYVGCRLRDDQSKSTGRDVRTLFEVLVALGAYPKSQAAPVEDDVNYLARTRDDYVFTDFANGAVAITPHYKNIVEQWPGGFFRNKEQDEKIVSRLQLPEMLVDLQKQWVDGHEITAQTAAPLLYRLDAKGEPIAFASLICHKFEVDGRAWRFADRPDAVVAFAPLDKGRLPDGYSEGLMVLTNASTLYLPAALGDWSMAESYRDSDHSGQHLERVQLERTFAPAEGTKVVIPQNLHNSLLVFLK